MTPRNAASPAKIRYLASAYRSINAMLRAAPAMMARQNSACLTLSAYSGLGSQRNVKSSTIAVLDGHATSIPALVVEITT